MSNVIYKGIDWNRTFTTIDVDAGTASNLSAMTGANITLELRLVSSGANVLSYTIGAGLTLSGGGTGGIFTLIIPAATTAGLATANHVYRVVIMSQVVLDWTKVTVRD